MGLGVAQSVTISKRKHVRYVGFAILGILLIFVFVVFFFWMTLRSNLVLAKNISSDANFYFSLKVPNTKSLYNRLKFWNSNSIDLKLNRLYTNFVQVNLDEIFSKKDISLFFDGVIEVVKLDTGEVVLSSKLKNKDMWLSLMFNSENKYAGEMVSIGVIENNFLQSISDQENWFWYIDKGRVYFVNSKSAREKINSNQKKSVYDVIDYSRKDIGIFYSSNISGIFNSENLYANILANSVSSPFILHFENSNNGIILRTNKAPKNQKDLTENAIKKLYESSNFNIKARIGDIKSSDIVFEDSVSNILNQIQVFLSELYGIDFQKLDKKTAFSNLAIFILPKNSQNIQEDNWLIVSEFIELSDLEQFGISSFAKQHPIRVENILRDGSIMIEMRAEEEGLLWEDFSISLNNQEFSFKRLQAQGEEQGYFIGSIFGLGNILTNSEVVLNEILQNYSNNSEIYINNECNLDFLSKVSSHFDISFLSETLNLDYLDIMSSEEGNLYGCIVFSE